MIGPMWLWQRWPWWRRLHWSWQDLKGRLFPHRSPWLTRVKASDPIVWIEWAERGTLETFRERKWYWGELEGDAYAEVTEVT